VDVKVLAILVPAVATVLTAIIGAVITVSGKNREGRVNEVYQAFDNRGKLVDSLNERTLALEHERDELKAKVDETERKCAEEIAALRREIEELHTMGQIPPRRRTPRKPHD
jgi:peptidoglycan hydrolase CwlO-like protein